MTDAKIVDLYNDILESQRKRCSDRAFLDHV